MSRDLHLGRDANVEVNEIPPVAHLDGPWDPNVDQVGPPVEAEPPAETEARSDAAPTARRRWQFFPRTLAGRLIVGVVSLVLLLVLAMGFATYALLRPFLYGQLDQQLRPLANSNAARIDTCLSRSQGPSGATCNFGNRGGFHAPQSQWIAVYDAKGDALLDRVDSGGDYLLLTLSADDIGRVLGNLDASYNMTSVDGADIRVTGLSTPDGIIVVTGLSTSEVSNTLHRVVIIELAIGVGALLLALLATLFGVRYSLRPIRRVTSTAREVTAELSPEGAGLDRRVPVAPSEVDSEAGQMAESVNTLLGAVETQFAARVESEERMRQFMADASHELRTPLTSIRGYAELARMRRGNGTVDPEHDADTLARIESEGTRMSRLVEDLLLLARSDQGAAPQLEPIDSADLVATAVEGVRAAFPDRRIDVEIPAVAPVLYGDYDQLLRVLRNLLTNAAVHTDPHGPIRVRAYRADTDNVVSVEDAGPGLPPEEAAQVFDRFWRADKARTRARGGTGLGMAIVRSLVEAHGGTVRFDSDVATGSTVTVRLPVAAPVAAETDS